MVKNHFPAKKLILPVILAVLAVFPVFAQNSFVRGEAFFLDNRPMDALQHLEAAVAEDPAHVQAFIYLGIVYQQLGRIDDAISAYQRILSRGGSQTASIAYNLGNAYLSKGSLAQASDSFSRALISDPSFSMAYLNRANTYLQMGSQLEFGTGEHRRIFDLAISDYERYLSLEPRSPQRENIERLVSFIREERAAEERRIREERAAEERRIAEERAAEEMRIREARIAEERRLEEERVAEERRIAALRAAEELRIAEERAAEERRRIAAEEAARIERERRQRLLEEISASLQAAAEDSRSLAAGNEGIQGYDGEFELE